MNYTTSKFIDNKPKKSILKSFFNKILICIILFLLFLIISKTNPSLKSSIYNYIYENNISFSKLHELYDTYLGGILPFDNLIEDDTVSVFNESLSYKNLEEVDNGIKLTVEDNYLVPIIESGIVVYIGEKENYGDTIIIQQVNGIDVWYCNINSNVELYDYVEKGSLLGESKDNNIYLYFQKNGEFVNYKEYL